MLLMLLLLLLSVLLLVSVGRRRVVGRRVVVDAKVIGRLATQDGVQVSPFQLLDDEHILDDILRRADICVVHQFVVQPPADFRTRSP